MLGVLFPPHGGASAALLGCAAGTLSLRGAAASHLLNNSAFLGAPHPAQFDANGKSSLVPAGISGALGAIQLVSPSHGTVPARSWGKGLGGLWGGWEQWLGGEGRI